jgi:hypothetical protein
MKRLLLFIAFCGCFTMLGNSVQAGCCNPQPPLYGTWVLAGSECTGTAGTMWYEDGAPGTWLPITSVTQNNCGDSCPDGNPTETTYSQTTGYSYSICFGTGFTMVGLSLNASGCYEYNCSSTSSVTLSVTAGACAAKKKTAYARSIPMTIHHPVSYSVSATWNDAFCDPASPPGSCTTTNTTDCGTQNHTATTSRNEYQSVSENLSCPPGVQCCCI